MSGKRKGQFIPNMKLNHIVSDMDGITAEQYHEAMEEMACWTALNHIYSCKKCQAELKIEKTW